MSFSGTAEDVLKSLAAGNGGVAIEPVILESKENFFVSLWKLQKHNITSAPVWDAEKKEYVGMVDMLDLVTFALMTFEDRKMLYEREFLQYGSGDLVNKPEYNAHLISNMSTRNKLISVRPNAPLSELIHHFSAESGAHRVCVMDENKKLIGLISQTDLIRFVAERDFKELSK